jgi:hypothetical protein
MLGQGALGQFTLGQPEDGGAPPFVAPVVGVARFEISASGGVDAWVELSANVSEWIELSAETYMDVDLTAETCVDLRILRETV